MRLSLTLLMLCFAFNGYSQKHRYVKIATVQAGVNDNNSKVFVTMPDFEDSSRYYTGLKFSDVLHAVEKLESKGYELVSITPSSGMAGTTITIAIMRRRLKT